MNRHWCNGGVNHVVSPWEYKAAALEGQGRSLVPPAYRNIAAAHLVIQSSAVPCKPGPGIWALVLVKESVRWGSPESSGAQAWGRALPGAAGRARQPGSGAQGRQSQPEPQPPNQGLP